MSCPAGLRAARALTVCLLAILVGAGPASAQGTLVDLRDFAPRELKMGSFTLDAPQTVRIEAVGAESRDRDRWGNWDWDDRKDRRWDAPAYWPGEAWLLDARTREVVWVLREADTDERRGVHTFEGTMRLPAGTYEAYYASFPGTSYYVWNRSDDEPKHVLQTLGETIASLFDGDRRQGYGGEFIENGAFRDFRLVVRGAGRTGDRDALTTAHEAFNRGTFVSLVGLDDEVHEQQGFRLTRPTEIAVYAVGEARRDEAYDYGWILNADTRETVWSFDGYTSEWAGGSDKNRVVRETLALPAGRYAAFFVTDDSHSPERWNAVPAYDPAYWGLTLRAADPTAIELFDYEHVPAADAFVALTRVRDRAVEAQGFTLDRRTAVRVYALGEGDHDDRAFHDYGWIVDADTRETVWDMRDERTAHAGGAQKNRLFDGLVTLDAGDYLAYYLTDDSHAYGDWNASPPVGGEHWGLTLLAPGGADRIRTFDERAEPGALAQITRVRDGARERQRFSLDRDTDVRIVALGEGDDEMYDYGWIEDARTGRAVWEMTYRMTEHAGGARKNRRAEATLRLPAGDYELRYRSDGSHAFGDWNARPPDDPLRWGITVYRAAR